MTPMYVQFLPLLVACLFLLGPVRAFAQTYCSAPVRPFCVGSAAVYEDKLAMQRCGADIRAYAQRMRAHAECLKKQSAEAMALAEEMERRYACMRERGEDCR